ncbi:hypothetical protein [Pseudogracilibacillus sp. SO30301A]|uniref:hypothetical protein n=1 Tax=Pseudogracilibacillus sp. SO30301A TaxID=3098291 RepID=UPI00300DC7D2
MKQLRNYFLIFYACLFLLGCQTFKDQEENETTNTGNLNGQNENEKAKENVSEIDIFDFENFGRTPEATEKHSIDEVIKIYFSEWTFDDPFEPIAINIETDEIYVNPSLSFVRFSTYDEVVKINQTEQVLEILETYDVQSWKTDYTFEDPDSYEDGYSWRLWLQFADGTVEKYSGEGTNVEKLTPDNFQEFAKELRSFVEEKLKESED